MAGVVVVGTWALLSLIVGCFVGCLVGCFDAYQVSPGLVVNAPPTAAPADASADASNQSGRIYPFDWWECVGLHGATCSPEPADAGGDGFASVFVLTYPDDPTQIESAGVIARAPVGVDLSAYSHMVVSVELESRHTSLPITTMVIAELGCSQAVLDIPGYTTSSSVQLGLPPLDAAVWTTHHLTLLNFVQPSAQAHRIVGGAAACLRQVDAISFMVGPRLGTEDQVTGILRVNDLLFVGARER